MLRQPDDPNSNNYQPHQVRVHFLQLHATIERIEANSLALNYPQLGLVQLRQSLHLRILPAVAILRVVNGQLACLNQVLPIFERPFQLLHLRFEQEDAHGFSRGLDCLDQFVIARQANANEAHHRISRAQWFPIPSVP